MLTSYDYEQLGLLTLLLGACQPLDSQGIQELYSVTASLHQY